jgi:hypothetical protein
VYDADGASMAAPSAQGPPFDAEGA